MVKGRETITREGREMGKEPGTRAPHLLQGAPTSPGPSSLHAESSAWPSGASSGVSVTIQPSHYQSRAPGHGWDQVFWAQEGLVRGTGIIASILVIAWSPLTYWAPSPLPGSMVTNPADKFLCNISCYYPSSGALAYSYPKDTTFLHLAFQCLKSLAWTSLPFVSCLGRAAI